MRIVSYRRDDGDTRFGIVDGEVVLDAGDRPRARSRPVRRSAVSTTLHLLAPVPRPGKVVCVGRNYAEHAAETGSPVPDQPQLFAKWANAVVGPGVDVVHHPITDGARLRGRAGGGDRPDRARGCPRTGRSTSCSATRAANDVSARDLQFGDTQWIRGKALDTFAPTGPWIVTADEIPDPQALGIRCIVNGETRQDDTHRQHGVRRRAAHRVHHRGDHARARRPDLHRARRPASATAWCRRATSRSATTSASRSTASAPSSTRSSRS